MAAGGIGTSGGIGFGGSPFSAPSTGPQFRRKPKALGSAQPVQASSAAPQQSGAATGAPTMPGMPPAATPSALSSPTASTALMPSLLNAGTGAPPASATPAAVNKGWGSPPSSPPTTTVPGSNIQFPKPPTSVSPSSLTAWGAQNQGVQNQIIGPANSALNYFMGSNPQQTGLYKSLLSAGTGATNQAFDNAQAAQALRANVAGLGYEQPMTQAMDTEMGAQRASALAQVPNQALMSTIQPELQAANLATGEASLYSPVPYMQSASQLQQQQNQSQMALFAALLGAGGGIFNSLNNPASALSF